MQYFCSIYLTLFKINLPGNLKAEIMSVARCPLGQEIILSSPFKATKLRETRYTQSQAALLPIPKRSAMLLETD